MPASFFSQPTWQRLAVLFGWLTILFSLTGLIGWLFDSFLLRSFLSDGATMKCNTALMLLSGGCALLALCFEKAASAKLLIVVMAVIALLTLAEYLFKVDLHIDQLLFHDRDTNPLTEAPGRPSVFTLINALFLAATLWLATLRYYRYSQAIAALSFFLIYGSLLGHIFGVSSFYRQGKYSGIAFHTAISFMLLIFGTLFYQAAHGWITLFFRKYRGRNIITYILTIVLTAVPTLIAFYLLMIRDNRFSPMFAALTLALLMVLISIPLIYAVLRQLSRLDNNLFISTRRLEIALEAAQLGSYDLDLTTGKMVCTSRCKANFGLPPDAVFDFPDLISAIRPAHRERVKALVDAAIADNAEYHAEYEIDYPGGGVRWISAHGVPQYGPDGNPLSIIGITNDITLQKENEQRKNDFIGMVSHELKTPLTSLSAIIQLLNAKMKNSSDEIVSGGLQKAALQVKKMSTMITGFLNVTRLESSHLLLNRSGFLLDDLIAEVIEDNHLIYPRHEFVFGTTGRLKVNADREKIGQVIQNLVSNAVKYAPGSYRIILQCEKKGGQAWLSVKDEGMGISPLNQEKLFDRFYRVNDNTLNPISGFGIGLYLCAEIIRLHNGRIWVDSELKKGADFQFSIPAEV